MITVSVVSHGHGHMVSGLVNKVLSFKNIDKVIVTLNLEETLDFVQDSRIQIIENPKPKGFGSNHNAAFRECVSEYFCVLNPDVEFLKDPFPDLVDAFECTEASLVAPLVQNSQGDPEDCWRKFPSPLSLGFKALGLSDGSYDLSLQKERFSPDWIAGMFLLIKSEKYASINGFDEKFFLYYEDVDLCVRLQEHGCKIVGCLNIQIIHNAHRSSHINLRYAYIHFRAMLRYFMTDLRRVVPSLLRGYITG